MKPKSLQAGRLLLLLLLLASVVSSAGCVAAGLAAAGAAAAAGAGGYAYYKGRMTRDYPAALPETLKAAETSLSELGFPVLDRQDTVSGATLITETTRGTRLMVDLTTQGSAIPSDGTFTRVGIRVGVFGDEDISDRILDRMSLHLVPGARTGAPVLPPGSPVPGSMQPGGIQPIAATGGPAATPIPVSVMDSAGPPRQAQPAAGPWRSPRQ